MPSYRLHSLVIGAVFFTTPAQASMQLGVTTHFNQGWPISLLTQVKAIGAPTIRDGLTWTAAEKVRGKYDFSKGVPLAAACRADRQILAVLNPTNPLYDGNVFVTSPEGQRAFSAYVAALAARYPCIAAIEVGNEINGAKWFSGPDQRVLAESYVSLLRAIRSALPRQGAPKILGGSTNMIGTGFLKPLFAAGMLDVADGVVVHPYRRKAEGLDLELEGLNRAMKQAGLVKPIWVTEFSENYDTPDAAAIQLIKEVAMMSAEGVEQADWYALIDEPFFKNMGLFAGTIPKPAAHAFKQAERLLQAGDAVRLHQDEDGTYIYRFGANAYVMWGAPRTVSFDSGAQIHNVRGEPMANTATLGDEPIVATNVQHYELGAATIAADSLLQFGKRPWSYFLVNGGGQLFPAVWTDGRFGSHFSAPGFRNFTIDPESITLGAPTPSSVIERYTASRAQTIFVSACVTRKPTPGTLSMEIHAAGKTLFAGDVDGVLKIPATRVDLAAGEPMDLVYRSASSPAASLTRRIQLSASPQTTPACP